MPANNTIQIRKGIESAWSTTNPVLASGEPGYDISNKILKIGDGSSAWNSLSNHHHVSSDITDFNTAVSGLTSGLQPSLVDPVTGNGTVGYLTKWISSSGIGDSIVYQENSNIGIGSSAPTAKLTISNGNFAVDGDSQLLVMTLRRQTSDNTEMDLYIDNVSKKMVIPPNTVWNFTINISCISNNSDGAASFSFKGCIKRISSTAFVGLYQQDSFVDTSLSGISASLYANTVSNSLDIRVQGLNSNTIRWTALAHLVQTSFSPGEYFTAMKVHIVP